jgi:hypothetical protein
LDLEEDSGSSQLDFDDIPRTPSPSDSGFYDYACEEQGGFAEAPEGSSPAFESNAFSRGTGWMSLPGEFDLNCHSQVDAVLHYLLVSEAPAQRVAAPQEAPRRLQIHEELIAPVPVGPVFNADHLMADRCRLEAFAAHSSQNLSSSGGRIDTRFKEVDVGSSQASTADATDISHEEAPQQAIANMQQNANLLFWNFNDLQWGRAGTTSEISDSYKDPVAGRSVMPSCHDIHFQFKSRWRSQDSLMMYCDGRFPAGSNTHNMEPEDLNRAHMQFGSESLPSVGSRGHSVGICKPCAFVSRSSCGNGTQCEFCHLCEPGEKKRRRKEKKAAIMQRRMLNRAGF